MPNRSRVTRRLGLKSALAASVALPLSSTALPPGPAPAGKDREEREDRGEREGRGGPLEVMSFNLRFAGTAEPHSWTARRPVMRRLLRREQPHVIGTQEGLHQQLRDIGADLGPSYDWIGSGRAGGSRDEFMAVLYDTRRLAPLEYDHFWLSDTPYLIASNTWGNAHIRMVTWVRFRDLRADGREFYVLNTHLDNASRYARERAAALIAERVTGLARSLPVIVTGDFNVAAHGDPVYDTMLGAGLVDTWDAAAERGEAYGTFHGYGPLVPGGARIDWVLATPGVVVHRASVNTYAPGGRFPSDHLPVQASLTPRWPEPSRSGTEEGPHDRAGRGGGGPGPVRP
ncbi:endonuclease/exonuclease/phosphatase family protein [Streptomyces prasinus]|uniref:endonuclease/exonuclease/phosphatase family protein n=1 Tax=Streptomyces prasinus TaxID=67345 RepID=UPI003328B894